MMTVEDRSWRNHLGAALLLVLTAAAFSPVVNAGFFWDDQVWLWNDAITRDGGSFVEYFDPGRQQTPDYFPITSSLLHLQWWMWGRSPLGYHLVNLIEHALACVVLWRIFIRLLPGRHVALAAAALFAVHPLTVTSVGWITEQKNTLSLLLYATSLWCWLRSEEQHPYRWYAASLAAFILALLTKTSGVTLPIVFVAVSWLRRGQFKHFDWLRAAPLLLASLAAGLITLRYHGASLPEYVNARPEGIGSRIAAASWAVWFYLYKLVWPTKLMVIYPRWKIDGGDMINHLPWLIPVISMGVLWANRKRACVVSICFVIALLPVLGFVTMSMHELSLVADHWVYPALPIMIGGAVGAVAKPFGEKRIAWLALLVIITLAALTFTRARLFQSERAVWLNNIDGDAKSWASYHNLGMLAARRGDSRKAITHLRAAARLNPQHPKPHGVLGAMLMNDKRYEEALAPLNHAVMVNPNYGNAHSNLGACYTELDRVEEAAGALLLATQLKPNDAITRNRMGILLGRLGRFDEAIEQFETALRFDPANEDARNNLAHARKLRDAAAAP